MLHLSGFTFQTFQFIVSQGSGSLEISLPVLTQQSATLHLDDRTHTLTNLPIISNQESLGILTQAGLFHLNGLHQHMPQTSCRKKCRCRTLNIEEPIQE
jgi:hypothetical protein